MKLEKLNKNLISVDNLPKEVESLIIKFQFEFKEQLEKYPETNSYWYLLRFLKARNFNYEKAKIMLSNFYKFRETLNFKIIKEQ